jgi:hypothetical protein
MKSSKTLPLLIMLLLTVSTTLIANPAAALVSKPEFSLQYVDHSYDIPPTYGKDPYTGDTIITNYGRHVDNRTIEVTIKNQPFTPYKDTDNHTIELCYNVRSKGHFEDWAGSSGGAGARGLVSSASSYTVISINIENWNVRSGGQIDFQVGAVTGYPYYNAGSCGTEYLATIEESGWSDPQTITIGNPVTPTPSPYTSWPTLTASPYPTASAQPLQNATSTPIQPGARTGVLFGFDWEQTALIVMAVVIAVLAVALALVMWRKAAAK